MRIIQPIRVVERKIADRNMTEIINSIDGIGFSKQKNKIDALFWIIDAMTKRGNEIRRSQEENKWDQFKIRF